MHSRSRAFIRHPIEIPIEVAAQNEAGHCEALKDLSFGGLAFGTTQAYLPGTLLGIRIDAPAHPVQLAARVAWCRRNQDPTQDGSAHYEVGVAFEDGLDAFRIRMVEQVCQIERYRLTVLGCEGRTLSTDEAAHEWIERFADRFYPQS